MNVYEAINKVQADLAKIGISKNDTNQSQGYKFRGIDAIYNAIAPLLAQHGLIILPRVLSRSVTEKVNQKGTLLFYTTVESEFDFVSMYDQSKHVVKTYGEAMDSGDKSTNKAMSAAYKYACMQAFCIPTEGDNDADATTHEVVEKFTPEQKSLQSVLFTRLAQCRDKIEVESWLDEFKTDIDSLPKEMSEVLMMQYENRIEKNENYYTGKELIHGFAGVDDAAKWAGSAVEIVQKLTTLSALNQWEEYNRPMILGLEVLSAKKYLKDGKLPKERFQELLMKKRSELTPVG